MFFVVVGCALIDTKMYHRWSKICNMGKASRCVIMHVKSWMRSRSKDAVATTVRTGFA